jgi:phage-related minor tail protein
MNEALQQVQVHGLQMLEEGILGVITGTKKLKDAFHDMAAAILADLLKIAIEKYVIGTIMNALGMGAPAGARASGGPVLSGRSYLVGEKGPELFTPASSGHIVSNDNLRSVSGGTGGASPRLSLTFHNDYRGADAAAVAAISARQDRFEAELPGKIVTVYHEARTRNMIRDNRR